MGMSTVTAGRIYRGQEFRQSGEQYRLAFEKFPFVGLAKTYNVNAQVGDSAACATALFCGAKTNFHRVGVDSTSDGNLCTGGRPLSSLIEWAQRAGKATGLVTNTRLTHSTPSAAYAHVLRRDWESHTDSTGCKDIARQLVEDRPGRDINVLFGGGRLKFMPSTATDPVDSKQSGERSDGRNLIDDWRAIRGRHDRRQRHYVYTKYQFDNLQPETTDSVLGLFSPSHMSFERDRNRGPSGEPSLAEMTVKAIQILSQKKHKRGFLLIVEAGRIDHGHHVNSAWHALTELAALDDAVRAVLATVDPSDTLVVATADHSHVFTLGGNRTPRGTPITGLDSQKDINGVPYTTLLYGNGPGYVPERNITRLERTHDSEYRQETAVNLRYETHAGEDVPVYATGPRSHLFTGTFEQSYVAHAISYAACIGHYRNQCQRPVEEVKAGGDTYRPQALLVVLGVTMAALRARQLGQW
ncbi:alkaline phosphatase, tissue-nonspecific isozyme-like [Amphibalanus amphitrite]|uniref:alkaline phosphatase, tissue-nonspecific isozyme-like n=1 Tax=Amphibalanus amphitrite TaxID=1232801 RepID=UPI001C9202E9|nr:alkaline phosphatase, tissue-nonspecific isozyme-like [Amphibalanus amphitrite]